MAYIGNTQQNQNYVPAIDYFSGNGSTTAFTLSRPVASVAQVQAVIENVPQNPGDAYTVSGNTITFTSAPPSGTNNIYVYYTSPNTQVVQPGQGTVGTTQMADGVTVNFNDGSASAPSITNSGDTNTGMFFPAADTIAFSEGGVESMRIDSSGNVGIGTSSPGSKLQVTGPNVGTTAGNTSDLLKLVTSSGNSDLLIFEDRRVANGSSHDTTMNFIYRKIDGSNMGYIGFGSSGSAYPPLAFGNNATENMRIDSSGNVLVNNTSTVYGKVCSQAGSFDPNTSTWATNGAGLSTFGNYGGGLVMIDGSAGYVLWVQDAGKDFYIRGNAVGSTPTGGVYINDRATSWSAASDENVKDIIEPITNGLEKVSTLRTVIGKYKDEAEGKRHPFLIAQDVQAVLPEAVSIMNKDTDNECLGLSYTDVIPLLVSAIQELKAIVDEQAEKIKALEAK